MKVGIMQDMERVFELNFGEIDKNSGKPIIHELHIDLDEFSRPSVLPLMLSSMLKHESWRTKESLELEKKLVDHFLSEEVKSRLQK